MRREDIVSRKFPFSLGRPGEVHRDRIDLCGRLWKGGKIQGETAEEAGICPGEKPAGSRVGSGGSPALGPFNRWERPTRMRIASCGRKPCDCVCEWKQKTSVAKRGISIIWISLDSRLNLWIPCKGCELYVTWHMAEPWKTR